MSTPGDRARGTSGVGWVDPVTSDRASGNGRWIAGVWTRNQFREIRRLLEDGHHAEALALVTRIDEALKT